MRTVKDEQQSGRSAAANKCRLHSALLLVQPKQVETCDHNLLRSEHEPSWEITHKHGGLAFNILFRPGSVHSSALLPTFRCCSCRRYSPVAAPTLASLCTHLSGFTWARAWPSCAWVKERELQKAQISTNQFLLCNIRVLDDYHESQKVTSFLDWENTTAFICILLSATWIIRRIHLWWARTLIIFAV